MFEKIITEPKYDVKLFKIYKHSKEANKCYLIKGCCQDGNDHILKNIKTIFKKYLNIDVDVETLIWMHGDGPSPHFILYKEDDVKINSIELEKFIKSILPSKSNKNKELSSANLSDVILTDISGLVKVRSKPLKKLL
jgi:hypothetical protein